MSKLAGLQPTSFSSLTISSLNRGSVFHVASTCTATVPGRSCFQMLPVHLTVAATANVLVPPFVAFPGAAWGPHSIGV